MLTSLIKEKLQRHPHIPYEAGPNSLVIPAQNPTGFSVRAYDESRGFTVGFDGWHERFADAHEALDCFGFGLTTACKLRVWSRGKVDYKWQVLHQEDGEWVCDSETGLLFFPVWRSKAVRILQNDLIRVAQRTPDPHSTQ